MPACQHECDDAEFDGPHRTVKSTAIRNRKRRFLLYGVAQQGAPARCDELLSVIHLIASIGLRIYLPPCRLFGADISKSGQKLRFSAGTVFRYQHDISVDRVGAATNSAA